MTTNCESEKELEKLRNVGFTAYSFTKDFQKENKNVTESDLNIRARWQFVILVVQLEIQKV